MNHFINLKDISIGDLRSINVNFVGNVNFPGVYQPTSELSTDVREAAEKGILAGDPLITKDFVSRFIYFLYFEYVSINV